MNKIYVIISKSRNKNARGRWIYILKRKLKFYTKESLKFFNITLIAFGFIIAITLIKYKPMYEVTLSGEVVGYVQNKEALEENIENNVKNYDSKNVSSVTLTENPEYELKLIEKKQDTNESEIIVALQKKLDITYKYYEIKNGDDILDSLDTAELAEEIVELAKEQDDVELQINEVETKNVEEIKTSEIEVAKSNILTKTEEETSIANIEGIKIAVLPVTGTVTSRYGEVSSIRFSTHTGLDIAASKGTPIMAVADGTVISAAYTGSYGYLVKIDHGNGMETWYGHTSKMYVTTGQQVSAGDVIAAVGSTGNSTGPHLHFEIRINGTTINPQKYLYN